MLIDITLKLTPELLKSAPEKDNPALAGHLGTHFDVMDKVFPLEYTRRKGILFDVSSIRDRDIEISDIDPQDLEKDLFVLFRTGWSREVTYGSREYFARHPQLSVQLIELLLEKGVSIIALDCGGVRRGSEHTPMDQRCADRGVFVVENLFGLEELPENTPFTAYTFPMAYTGLTGLPCRVVAEV